MCRHGAGDTPKRKSAIGRSWIGYSVSAGQGSAVTTCIDPKCRELIWHAVPIFNVSTAHNADDERLPHIATSADDRLGHGAVPELLRADETFEPFGGCVGVLTSGWVLLKPLKQPVAITRRGRCRPPTPSRSVLGTNSNPCVATRRLVARSILSASIGMWCIRAKLEQRQVELAGEAPDLRPFDFAEEVGFAQFAIGPTVEHWLDAPREHLETKDHVGSVAEQRRDRIKLPAMVLGLVVRGFAEQHDAALGERYGSVASLFVATGRSISPQARCVRTALQVAPNGELAQSSRSFDA